MLAERTTYIGRARKTCSLSQASQRGAAGNLMKVKRNYCLEQVVKFEGCVPIASNVWNRSAGCQQTVLNHEYVYIVKPCFIHTVISEMLPAVRFTAVLIQLLWTLFRVSLVSWELKVQLGPWDLQDQLVCQGKKDREVRMGSLGQLEKKVIR